MTRGPGDESNALERRIREPRAAQTPICQGSKGCRATCGPFTGDWRHLSLGGEESPGLPSFAGVCIYSQLVDGPVMDFNSPRPSRFLNDEHRRLVDVIVPPTDHAERAGADVNQRADRPIGP